MQRRKFLRTAGIGGGAAVVASTVAAPAIAQSMPELKWRLASSFPKSLDTLFGGGENFAKFIGEMTDNKFQVRIFAAGEIVPGLQVLDAVQNGTVEMGHSAGTYYIGKDPTLAFDTDAAVRHERPPAGSVDELTAAARSCWPRSTRTTTPSRFPAATPARRWAAGSARRSRRPEDMKGLKFRIAGIAGMVCAKLGSVPQQIAGGDIYPALEKGTIDAAEWVGPYDDQKLGFNKIAPYYYYPGWWEGGPQTSAYVNLDEVERAAEVLPGRHPGGGRPGADADVVEVRRGKSQGAARADGGRHQAAAVPAVGDGSRFNASNELYAEISAKNPKFKKVYENWKPFRNEEILWFRVAEFTFDNFMARQSAANKLG